MKLSIDWQSVIEIAFCAGGTIQYLKTWFKKADTRIWAVALPVLILFYAAAFQYLPPFVVLAALALNIGQLGYDNIVSAIETWIQSNTGINLARASKPAPAAGPAESPSPAKDGT